MEHASVAGRPRIQVRTCACGQEYQATYYGDTLMTPQCPRCTAALGRGERGRKPAAAEILDALDELGFNVQEHGWLTRGPHAGEPGTLDNLGAGQDVEDARAFVQAVIAAGRWRPTPSVWVSGHTGTGKSQLAFASAYELLRLGVPKHGIVYDRGRSMVTRLQDRYKTGTVDEFSDRRRRARVWFYEDAGTEKLTPDAFRVVEDILDRRQGRATFTTSNYTRQQAAERWNEQEGWERLRSRLAPFGDIKLDGADWRFVRQAITSGAAPAVTKPLDGLRHGAAG